jgi:hypothetical protein
VIGAAGRERDARDPEAFEPGDQGGPAGATTEVAPGSQPTGVDEGLAAQGRPGRPAEQRPQPRGGERSSATGTESGTRPPRRAARQRQPFALRADTTSALGASEATADPETPLYRKGPGQEARLWFDGHLLIENRHGLCSMPSSPRLRPCRAARGAGNARPAAVRKPDHARCRPQLRCPGLRHGIARAAGDPAHRPEHQQPALGDRWPNHPPPRAMMRASASGTVSRSLRLDQGHRRSVQDQAARPRAGTLVVHVRGGRLQPRAPAETAGNQGSRAVSVPMDCRLIGRWRIVEADLWDRAHLDLVEPAMMTIGADGRGAITCGAMQGGLELEYARSTVFFTWRGSRRWTRSAARDRPSCKTTAHSRSRSPTTSATRRS